MTDTTEHPTREGKIYCCVVLDVYSRRVVGWAIDSRQRADLATSALGIELANAIFEYIEGFYNRRRRHSALDYMTPIQFETTHTPNLLSSPPGP